jgi:hypothetical protein
VTDHDLAAARRLDETLRLAEQWLASPSPREARMTGPATQPAEASQRFTTTEPQAAEAEHQAALAAKEASDRRAQYVAELLVGIVALPIEDVEAMIAAHQWAFERTGAPPTAICRAIVNATTRTIDAATRARGDLHSTDDAKMAAGRTIALMSQIRARWQQRLAPIGGAR